MLEKDIENLIALHPDDFFPGAGFKLEGQQVRLGTLRADILFKDKYDRTIIIEVKRGILTRDAAGQILDYYGHVKQAQPETVVELILCANTIPSERRHFLENSGIECREIGAARIAAVASKFGYRFLDAPRPQPPKDTRTGRKGNGPRNRRAWIFQANPARYDFLNALTDSRIASGFHWLVQRYRDQIRLGDVGLIWLSGKEGGIYAVARVTSEAQLGFEPSYESKYWTDSEDVDVEKWRAKLELVSDLSNKPLLRPALKQVPDLQNLSIFRFAQGTNFKVTEAEWAVLSKILKNEHGISLETDQA